MNPALDKLHAYPFEKLSALKAGITPVDKPHIALSIGEPQHSPPAFVLDALHAHRDLYARYPATRGLPELREGIAGWLTRRFELDSAPPDPERHILPVAGTREALFAIAQAVVDSGATPTVLMPNPFYQIYEGAALLAGAEPCYLDCTADTGWLPDLESVSADQWRRCQLMYICTPGNPTGQTLALEHFAELLELADRHDFVLVSDECYSELYRDENDAPLGLLAACARLGRVDYRRCLVFHSLSKRSNLPGLRSGFVAGDAAIINRFLHYRTYQGCALPLPVQFASLAAWQDEAHVQENRERYRRKFAAVHGLLEGYMDYELPGAGFYLWASTPGSDTDFCQALYARQNVTVLPGQFLARQTAAGNPGHGRVRIALVADEAQCIEAAHRLRAFCAEL